MIIRKECVYMEQKRRVRVQFFKESGKYYTETIIEVPEELNALQISEGIENGTLCGMCRSMPYIYIDAVDPHDPVMYPHLIVRKDLL